MINNKQNYKKVSEGQKDGRIQEAINKILELFQSGNIPQTIALLTNPRINIPLSSWSLRNKLIAFANGTTDARGFLSWKQAGRHLKQGSKAVYILAPLIIQNKDADKTEEPLLRLVGFKPIPVFKVEDTEGQPLEYENIKLPEFRFLEVAKSWGLEVEAIGSNDGFYGCYSPSEKKILMASPEEEVFYHELAHASHDRTGLLSRRTRQQKEIVAEFASAVLIYLSNKETDRLGNAYEYLKAYSGGQDINKAVLSLISDIEKVLKLILETENLIKQEVSLICLN
jgi:hypothetical protein